MAGIQREGAKKTAQDGRFQLLFGTSVCDFRVATFPTVNGDKMAIRLLNDEISKYSLEKVFMEASDYKKVQRLISHKNGLILITGPTGSGKTTTLYSILNALNAPHVNIVTLEDPVEYQIAGINQCDIRAGSHFSFAEGLHAILRQDPNVIFVGEMRDKEASEIAMRASMTGHLVISTVHANSAVGTIIRLVDMGLEPYMVSYSLAGIIAQRLIRRICPKCKVSYVISEADLKKYRINPEIFTSPLAAGDKVAQSPQEGAEKEAPAGNVTLFKGRGCGYCNGTGYYGRVALFEILIPDDDIRDALIKGETHAQLNDLAVKTGTRPIAYDGLLKVRLGITTLDEVMEVLFEKVV
jgi:type II secretory ATPase GspE/PulE/Tfp pilus assembly ATPase PilB-like protein